MSVFIVCLCSPSIRFKAEEEITGYALNLDIVSGINIICRCLQLRNCSEPHFYVTSIFNNSQWIVRYSLTHSWS
jgi:hypothetical protein